MRPTKFLFPFFLLLLLLLSISNSANSNKVRILNPLPPNYFQYPQAISSSSSSSSSFFSLVYYETHFYEQTLDHFNYGPQSYTTFRQKYVINSKYWGGANSSSPIFAYLGAESPLDNFTILLTGFLPDNAPQFKALLVYMEHRFYGDSIPFGMSMEEAMKNESILGYFNSAQAIADYAEILLHVKERFSSPNSPIIVIGGSYGGLLAAWLRLKYPHIALGALASSAPILYFDNTTQQDGYYSIIDKDYKEASESCYQTIRKSWTEIDKIASEPNGLSILSQKFKACSTLKNSSELKGFLESNYKDAAQYDMPPNYPVASICGGIDGAAANGSDILGQIAAGVESYFSANGIYVSCYNINGENHPSETRVGWDWQTCSEMVLPIGNSNNDSLFPPEPFNLKQFIKHCKSLYGVSSRPHWVATYYGGHDIKLVLRKFASNIIFSNGLRDPHSNAGVLEDLSDSLVAVYTTNGAHCLDILVSRQNDPQWLVMQRKIEVQIIEGWIAHYYSDLLARKK